MRDLPPYLDHTANPELLDRLRGAASAVQVAGTKRLGIRVVAGRVVLGFDPPAAAVPLPPGDARKLAELLTRAADQAEGK